MGTVLGHSLRTLPRAVIVRKSSQANQAQGDYLEAIKQVNSTEVIKSDDTELKVVKLKEVKGKDIESDAAQEILDSLLQHLNITLVPVK